MKRRIPVIAATILASGSALAVDDAYVARCRAIAGAAERLACYDSISLPAPPTFAPSRAGTSPATPPAAQPAPAPPAQSAVAPVAKQTESQFGLEYKAHETELAQVRSRIKGHFGGWEPNQQIPLENGQIWQVADGTSRYLYLDDPAVTVKRGMMGAFYLDIEGTNHMPRVKRVR